MTSPLRRERERRGWSQEDVADRLRQLDPSCGIDGNAVSRHERQVVTPRATYQELYARLFEVAIHDLWPVGTIRDVDRRSFLQVIAAATGGVVLDGPGDDLVALQAITSGLRSLEPTTPSAALWSPVLGHLNIVGQRASRGSQYAKEAAEVARLAAWLAWDQNRSDVGEMYGLSIRYASMSRNEDVMGFMEGSRALWLAETGQSVPRSPRQGGTPWFSTMRATVASAAGDVDRTISSLKDAERLVRTSLDHQKVQGYTGRAYLRLGLSQAAQTSLREAVRGMAETKYKGVLLLELARVSGEDDAQALRAHAVHLGRELQSKRVLVEAER
jgi:hypothetical protein